MEEIEIKFLDIDIGLVEQKLKLLGATKVGETFSKISCFDYPDYKLAAKNGWIKLRTEFDVITLAYKERQGVSSNDGSTSDAGMKEVEINVSDFSLTREFLLSIGLMEKFSQEKKRIRWQKGDVVYDIDTWPKLNTYIELEGPTLAKVEVAAVELGFDPKNAIMTSVMQIYKKYGIDIDEYQIMGFGEWVKKSL